MRNLGLVALMEVKKMEAAQNKIKIFTELMLMQIAGIKVEKVV